MTNEFAIDNNVSNHKIYKSVIILCFHYLPRRLLAHCDEAEPVPEIISNIAATPEETPADTPSQNDVASTSNEVSTTEADVKSLKCDV